MAISLAATVSVGAVAAPSAGAAPTNDAAGPSYLLVGGTGSSNIGVLRESNGRLTPVGQPVPTNTGTLSIAVTANGRFGDDPRSDERSVHSGGRAHAVTAAKEGADVRDQTGLDAVIANAGLWDLGPKSWEITDPRARKTLAQRFVDQFEVRTLAPGNATLEELSGGNQQKVVLAKGLTRKPLVAIIDEPTRGVDLGTIPEIHAMIRALADDGVAVVVISSYLPEIQALSDRVLVARAGSIAAEFSPEEADEESLMFAAVH